MIDKKAFRNALGNFVTGVTIVTARDEEGRPVGLTANSFNSVSLDPPMVLWSLALDSANLPAFRNAKGWAVHILASDQEDLSNRFASRGADKFAGLDVEDGPEGAPFIPGCSARFGCKATFEYEGGDHAIFVGEVIQFDQRDAAPLIFHGGRYGRVMPPSEFLRPEELEDEGQFGRYFIGHALGLAHQAVFGEVRSEYKKRGLRSADYTVLTSLGLGDGCTPESIVERAAHGGVDLPMRAIDRLIEKGWIASSDGILNLTDEGRAMLTELVAVAQSTQLHLETALSPEEVNLLHDLLERVAKAAADRN